MIGKPRSYHKAFLFHLEFPGVEFTGFQKAGPIEAEVAVIEQYEGGALAPETSAGRYKAAQIVLERGATKDLDLYRWFKEVADIAANGGLVDEGYKRTGDLVQKDRDGSELRRITLVDAWPSKFKPGEWDNTSDANTIESVTLTYKYFDIEDPSEGG